MNFIFTLLSLALVSGQLVTSAFKIVGHKHFEKCRDGSVVEPPECPENDQEGLPMYFPFPYDCTQFYECSNGIARCIKCAPGTIWDQENLVCNHPAAVNCTIYHTTPSVPTTTDNPEKWICDDVVTGLIAHPTNCSVFYICDPGRKPCIIECPEGKCFNYITNTCENPTILKGPKITSQHTFQRKFQNNQNVNKDNFAQGIQFVANTITDKLHVYTGEDACEVLNFHIRNA